MVKTTKNPGLLLKKLTQFFIFYFLYIDTNPRTLSHTYSPGMAYPLERQKCKRKEMVLNKPTCAKGVKKVISFVA